MRVTIHEGTDYSLDAEASLAMWMTDCAVVTNTENVQMSPRVPVCLM